jgi:hypothetical protein
MYFHAAGGFVPSSRHIFYRGGHPSIPDDEEARGYLSARNEYGDLPLPR